MPTLIERDADVPAWVELAGEAARAETAIAARQEMVRVAAA
jgi:uncharacterized protein (UPF0276 family)